VSPAKTDELIAKMLLGGGASLRGPKERCTVYEKGY